MTIIPLKIGCNVVVTVVKRLFFKENIFWHCHLWEF